MGQKPSAKKQHQQLKFQQAGCRVEAADCCCCMQAAISESLVGHCMHCMPHPLSGSALIMLIRIDRGVRPTIAAHQLQLLFLFLTDL